MAKLFFTLFICNTFAFANDMKLSAHANHILWLSLLVIGAIFATLANKYRQSTVLGQLVIGSFIGILAHFHIGFFAEIINNKAIDLIAQLGSIFLLFEIGLESDFNEIRNAGKHAIQVAVIGVVVPFCLGYFFITPYIIQSGSHNLALFIGGILAVTSTSISISVFKELGIIRNKACQIVLTASVLDDIIGLILLSAILAIASFGNLDGYLVIAMLMKIISFFIVCSIVAKYILPKILIPQLTRLGKGETITTLFIVAICFTMSWFAQIIGLADIIGAFFAGLMLNYKIFLDKGLLSVKTNEHSNRILIDLISPLGRILTPIFFIYAGMQVDIVNAFKFKTMLIALIISIFAILGKAVCSITLPKRVNRLIVGFGMVPRGEIGIIFAITGLNIGIIDNELFTTLLLVIVITSITAPIALNKIVRQSQENAINP